MLHNSLYTNAAFLRREKWTPLTFHPFPFAFALSHQGWLFPHLLTSTFLAVTLPLLTSFILNTSAVLGWCSFIRDTSKQRVSSFIDCGSGRNRTYSALRQQIVIGGVYDTPILPTNFQSAICDSLLCYYSLSHLSNCGALPIYYLS